MRRALLLSFVLAGAACVPADEAVALGSATFTVKASRAATAGFVTADRMNDGTIGWNVVVDRVVLGFRTVTIGKVGDDDRCSFRGRGERSDVVFDPRTGLVQTFNGIQPADCEDVGIFLAPPGDTTGVGPGASPEDLFDLAADPPAHAIVEATARHHDESFRVRLRFDSTRTATRFGGCSAATRGIRVRANERQVASMAFSPENLFRDALGFGSALRLTPFLEADENGDGDGVATMQEVDALPLARLRGFGDFYQLPNGTIAGSFGDYLRALFRFTFIYRDSGACFGNEPGSE